MTIGMTIVITIAAFFIGVMVGVFFMAILSAAGSADDVQIKHAENKDDKKP